MKFIERISESASRVARIARPLIRKLVEMRFGFYSGMACGYAVCMFFSLPFLDGFLPESSFSRIADFAQFSGWFFILIFFVSLFFDVFFFRFSGFVLQRFKEAFPGKSA